MSGAPGNALEWALALVRAPGERHALRRRPLPPGIERLLAIAARVEPEETTAQTARLLGESPERLREAAQFYAREVLFHPQADAYRALGVGPDAGSEQIKTHHRLLQLWLHPDRQCSEDDSVFASRVNIAWNRVRNDERRRKYDLERAGQEQEEPAFLVAATQRLAPVWLSQVPPERAVDSWQHRLPVIALVGVCLLLGWLAVRNNERPPDAWGLEGGEPAAERDVTDAGGAIATLSSLPPREVENSGSPTRGRADKPDARAAMVRRQAEMQAANVEAAKAQAARLQLAKAQAAKVEAAKLQLAKAAAAKVQAAQLQLAKIEAAKAQAAKLQLAKAEATRAQAAKAQLAKAEAARAQAAKVQLAKAATAKAQAAQLQLAKTEAAKAQAAKLQFTKVEAAKAEAANAQAAKLQLAKAQAAKVQLAKTEAAKAQAAKVQLAKAEAAKSQAAKVQLAKAATAKAQAAQLQLAKAEAAKAQAAKLQLAKAEAAKAQAAKLQLAKAEATKAQAAKLQLAKAEAAKAQAAKLQLAKANAAKAQQSLQAPAAPQPDASPVAAALPPARASDEPNIARIQQARQVGATLLQYMATVKRAPPPIWNSPAIMSSADGLRHQLHQLGHARIGAPQWRIGNATAVLTSNYQVDGVEGAEGRGRMTADMVWRENRWLVVGLSVERAR